LGASGNFPDAPKRKKAGLGTEQEAEMGKTTGTKKKIRGRKPREVREKGKGKSPPETGRPCRRALFVSCNKL